MLLIFILDMEDRAAERARSKKEREEKRRKAEEERLVIETVDIPILYCQAFDPK